MLQRRSLLAFFAVFALGANLGWLAHSDLAVRDGEASEKDFVAGRSAEHVQVVKPRVAEQQVRPQVAPNTSHTPERERPASARAVADEARKFTVFIQAGKAYGAGAIIDGGYVLTCRHVIEGANRITVSTFDGTTVPAEVVEIEPTLDAAVLKADLPMGRAGVARIGSSSAMQMGDEVYAMGAPRKLRFSLSRGIVSHVGRHFDGVHYLQTDLPINTGNSGGPLLNDRGELVGIVSFVLRDSQGLAFALPVDYAYRRFAALLPNHLDMASFDTWLHARQASLEVSAR
jgi:S1-C subfamily serine protease